MKNSGIEMQKTVVVSGGEWRREKEREREREREIVDLKDFSNLT